MSRKIFIIGSLFFLQFTLTFCFSFGNCGGDVDRTQYTVKYRDLTVQAVNTSGFQVSEITDTINKSFLGITLSLNYDLVAHNFRSITSNFNVLLACSPAQPPTPIDKDSIRSIEILVTDVQTSQTSNVSSHFETSNPLNNSRLTVDKLPAVGTTFFTKYRGNPYFRLSLVKYEAIPTSAIFTLNVYLKSGKKLIKQTKQINFHAESR